MKTAAKIALAIAGAGVAYVALSPKATKLSAGDAAKRGDQATVDLHAVMPPELRAASNALFGGLGIGAVDAATITVATVTADTITGPIVAVAAGGSLIPITAPYMATFPRSSVTSVSRDGKPVAA